MKKKWKNYKRNSELEIEQKVKKLLEFEPDSFCETHFKLYRKEVILFDYSLFIDILVSKIAFAYEMFV